MSKMRDIHQTALKELQEEKFRQAVNEEKERLRRYVPFRHRVFPWKITLKIERRKHDTLNRR